MNASLYLFFSCPQQTLFSMCRLMLHSQYVGRMRKPSVWLPVVSCELSAVDSGVTAPLPARCTHFLFIPFITAISVILSCSAELGSLTPHDNKSSRCVTEEPLCCHDTSSFGFGGDRLGCTKTTFSKHLKSVLVVGVKNPDEKINIGNISVMNHRRLMTSMYLEMFAWLTNNGWNMARQEAAKTGSPPSTKTPLLHQWRSVASTHILPLWARNAKNPDSCPPPHCCPTRCSHPISPHASSHPSDPPTPASQWFYSSVGWVSGWLLA